MLLGHTGLNWALKRSPAYVVNLTLLGEPVGATLIAAFLPGIREVPAPLTFVGGAIVFVEFCSRHGASPIPRGPRLSFVLLHWHAGAWTSSHSTSSSRAAHS
jgi:hypothetical protein